MERDPRNLRNRSTSPTWPTIGNRPHTTRSGRTTHLGRTTRVVRARRAHRVRCYAFQPEDLTRLAGVALHQFVQNLLAQNFRAAGPFARDARTGEAM
ncbi:hypothetical protein [Nocardiopsis salina]|uniref:hypothetical protein n=1 Tax=Nocardiopsis salina TaxID=245836 RepID=UPI00037E319E|nr:hypothetical protein [Nocardiopsis salina]